MDGNFSFNTLNWWNVFRVYFIYFILYIYIIFLPSLSNVFYNEKVFLFFWSLYIVSHSILQIVFSRFHFKSLLYCPYSHHRHIYLACYALITCIYFILFSSCFINFFFLFFYFKFVFTWNYVFFYFLCCCGILLNVMA